MFHEMGDAGMTIIIPFDNSYARLPERFYAALEPLCVRAPMLIKLNTPLAAELGLDATALASPEGLATLSGNTVPVGASSIALAYAGHQFGGFVPQLGDGRALLMGEVIDIHDQRRDLQWKGSGPTPFSRRGDGRAALGPVLREYIVSEAMYALGIPTTRALSAVSTGEHVMRDEILPGGVLVRVAASHIRVGTFQYFAARGDTEAVRLLTDYTIARHYPECAEAKRPALALLEQVMARQAHLVARWLLVGFVHGVMNTDNMSVAGETLDYGPCAFLDGYDPDMVFSSIDQHGRYAYGAQPRIAQWNLARLAETLLPLLDADQTKAVELANGAISGFGALFEAAYLGGLRSKCGLLEPAEGDLELIRALLAAMAEARADFTLTFRRLGDAAGDAESESSMIRLFADETAIHNWLPRWRARLAREAATPTERQAAMQAANPAYIARNTQVEAALDAAVYDKDYAPFHRLIEVLAKPYDERPAFAAFMQQPKPGAPYRTFCGT
jgi:serine/tyrosine/threonine adenylyltransferase